MKDSPSPFCDVIRALAALSPEDLSTREQIVGLLGYSLKVSTEPGVLAKEQEVSGGDSIEQDSPSQSQQTSPELSSTPAKAAAAPLPASVRVVREEVRGGEPEWLHEVAPLEKGTGSPRPQLLPQPLLPPEKVRSILSLVISHESDRGEILVDHLVRDIARGEALRHVPRAEVPSLSGQVQLLLDRSEAMLPFLVDVDRIAADLKSVFGTALTVLTFSGSPLKKAGRGPRARWSDYFPNLVPPVGSRVICVSDLGIGSPQGSAFAAQPAEWLEFRRRLRSFGSSLAVLTFYGPNRWPPELVGRLNLLQWNHTTTAAAAQALAKRLS